MVAYVLVVLLAIHVITPTWALQVTPNSPCATLCIDYAGADPSDPNVSNTYGSDIVCNDADYTSTATGLKFKNCISCLQNSTATNTEETDQSWFFYNLRFAFNTCLFNSKNATDVVDTPCVLSNNCGPLEIAMEFDMQDYSVPLEYAYCSANGTAFASSYFGACQQCLRENTNVFYLSNFLTALEAGCAQQPANGSVIGLNGTLFTNKEVEIISPITAAALAAKAPHKILTRGAITGIAVAGVVALLISAACVLICIKKRRNSARLNQLRNPLHTRFGAENITAPNAGAFISLDSTSAGNNMYKSPQKSTDFHTENVKMQNTPKVRNFSIHRREQSQPEPEWEATPQQERMPPDSQSPGPPMYSPPETQTHESFPTHAAYIPPQYRPASRQSVSPRYHRPPSTEPQPLFSNPAPQSIPAPHPQRYSPSPSRSSDRSTGPPPGPQTPLALLSRSLSYRVPPPPPHPPPQSCNSNPQNPLSFSQHQDLRGSVRATDSSDPRITGPMIRVGTRFENEEDARRAREKLYREGLGSGLVEGSKTKELSPIEGSPASTTPSEEMWPGTF